jgi:hypothetical protein
MAVALQEAIQLQAECPRIQTIGLYPLVLLVQLLRTDHVALDPERAQLSLQTEAKPARFIHRVHWRSPAFELGRPVPERFLVETLRRLGIRAALLHHHHIKILMHINPKLDRASAAIKLAAGSLV